MVTSYQSDGLGRPIQSLDVYFPGNMRESGGQSRVQTSTPIETNIDVTNHRFSLTMGRSHAGHQGGAAARIVLMSF